MKPISILAIVTLLCFSMVNLHAQECQVALKAISGTYTGDCKKGKADGMGESIGTDKYKGEFKAGLPEGKGTYTFANGDVFDGLFNKGRRDGRGIMNYKRAGKADSVVKGVWSNDNYAGNFEHPYMVYQKSNNIIRVDVRKNAKSMESTITFNISSVSAGAAKMDGASTGTSSAALTDIALRTGSFSQAMDGPAGPRGTSKKLSNVVYPIRAVYRIGGQDLDLEISEPGEWTVTISMNQ
jgi:hypothetical protein